MSSRDARLTAKQYYASSARNLQTDLGLLSASAEGAVFWTPRLVMLMKAINHRTAPALWMEGESPAPDAWYVHLLAGDLQLALKWVRDLPPLPFFCF